MLLHDVVLGDDDHRPAHSVEVGLPQLRRALRHGVGRLEGNVPATEGEVSHRLRGTAAGSPGSLWQHYSDSDTLYDLLIKGMIHKTHPEHVATARVVKIFVGGHVVANVVAGLPASKERESAQAASSLLHTLRKKGDKTLNMCSIASIVTHKTFCSESV